MYRIKLAAGTVLEFDSLEALTAEIRTGEVDAEALIFHQRANQWLPIHVHPAWKQALAAIERSGHALPASARAGGSDTGSAKAPGSAPASTAAAPTGGTATRAARPVLRVPRPSAPSGATASTPSTSVGTTAPTPPAASAVRASSSSTSAAPAPTLADTLGLDLLELAEVAPPAPAAAAPAVPVTSAAAVTAGAPAEQPAPAPPKRGEPAVSVDNLDEELELLAPDEVPAAPARVETAAKPAPAAARPEPPAARPAPTKPVRTQPKRTARPAGPSPSLLDAAPTAPRSPMLEPQAVASDAAQESAPSSPTAAVAAAPDAHAPAPAPASAPLAPATTSPVRDESIERSRAGEPSIVTAPSAPTRTDAPMLAGVVMSERTSAADDAETMPIGDVAPLIAADAAVASSAIGAAATSSTSAPSIVAVTSDVDAPSPAAPPVPVPVAATDEAHVERPASSPGASSIEAPATAAPPIGARTFEAPISESPTVEVPTTAAPTTPDTVDPIPFTPARAAPRRLPPAILAAGLGITVIGLAAAAFAMRDRSETTTSVATPEPTPVADAGVPTAPLVLPPETEPAPKAERAPSLRIAPDDVPPTLAPAPATAAPVPARTEPQPAQPGSPTPRDAAPRRAAAPTEEPEALVAAPAIGPIDVGTSTITLRTDITSAVLASRYAAAHDAAWNDLVAKLRLAGFAQLFAPAKLAPGSAASTKVALAAARQHIDAWRTRAGVIEKAYRDSSAALQGSWSASERAAWEARPKRAESGEDAQTASALLGAADRMYAVLAANAGGYQLIGGELRFTDTGAQREYWEARRAFLAALGGAGEGGVRLPVGAIVSAVGATRPPDGTIAN